MAGRGRSSFTKRQKEHTRQEKRREKEERKTQRATSKVEGAPDDMIDIGESQAALFALDEDAPAPRAIPVEPGADESK